MEIARVAFTLYPRRAVLGLALFLGQAFLYNGVTFNLGTLLSTFYGVPSAKVPLFFILWALSNFGGPLLLGRLFDPVGRKQMISLTYLGSAVVAVVLAVLFVTQTGGVWTFIAVLAVAFFLASAGASAAYLTVSEVFPMETRALAIALFYAVGTATGGIVGPELFGQLINSGQKSLVAVGFFVGAGAMALGGIAELLFGLRTEQQSLEHIAKPLTVEEAEALLPLPVSPEAHPLPEAYHEQHEAVRSREKAEDERAVAAERRAVVQELRTKTATGESPEELRPEEIEAEIAELAAQRLEELAIAHEERAKAVQAATAAARRAALERAAAAEERARSQEERASALAAEGGPEADMHRAAAEAASERAREREQRGLPGEARREAEHLLGVAAELARARAEMHERLADVHAARAHLVEAEARRDEAERARAERELRDRELFASAAEQRVDAA